MFAQRRILLGGFWHADLDEQPNLAAVMKAIAANPGAIGIAGFSASPAANTHALALAESTAEPFIAANATTVASCQYPLQRPLYLAVNKRPDSPLPENVREFLRFVLSREGQEIVARYAHFFPLNAELASRERTALNGWLPPLDAALPTYVKSSQPVRGAIRSVGSDGMASLMNGWMRAFREVQPEVHPGARWEHPGTINGFNALVASETDLAPMGRELWPVEKLVHNITRGKNTLLEIRVARGGHATNGRTETIALVVNATNPLKGRTQQVSFSHRSGGHI
jgi:ABC-type phosphate transport system substrate-binding protein